MFGWPRRGAAYLVLGKSKNDRSLVKRDLGYLSWPHPKAALPLLIGTAARGAVFDIARPSK